MPLKSSWRGSDSELGAIVADVSAERSSILAALDLLITGY